MTAGWGTMVKGNPVDWLLEPDPKNPAIRYLALRDIIGMPAGSAELEEAREEALSGNPIAAVLEAQAPEGYWVAPGAGYSPKYTGTVWSVLTLAQSGADIGDERVRRAADYVLSHAIAPATGWFAYNGTPSGFIHCLSGNLSTALLELGVAGDERLITAIERQAMMITGEGVAQTGADDNIRYYCYTPGPGFACGPNSGRPCAWGMVKAMKALVRIPDNQRTPMMNKAIDIGRQMILGTDLDICDFPCREGGKPSGNWFKFGFPLFYISDVLEILDIMARLGEGGHPHLKDVWKKLVARQDQNGRWPLEYGYKGKIWCDIEAKGKPSKWVTLRALRALKTAFPG